MEDKKVSAVGSVTADLIAKFILFGILFSLIYRYFYSLLSNSFTSDSIIFLYIISIILQGILVFCDWRFSILSTFKRKLIHKSDVKVILKNLMIFSFIIWLISALLTFSSLQSNIEESLGPNSILTLSEYYLNTLSDEEVDLYHTMREDYKNEMKKRLYPYFAFFEVGLLVVYLGVVPLQKKLISKYTISDEGEN